MEKFGSFWNLLKETPKHFSNIFLMQKCVPHSRMADLHLLVKLFTRPALDSSLEGSHRIPKFSKVWILKNCVSMSVWSLEFDLP